MATNYVWIVSAASAKLTQLLSEFAMNAVNARECTALAAKTFRCQFLIFLISGPFSETGIIRINNPGRSSTCIHVFGRTHVLRLESSSTTIPSSIEWVQVSLFEAGPILGCPNPFLLPPLLLLLLLSIVSTITIQLHKTDRRS